MDETAGAVFKPSMPLLGYHPEQGEKPPLLPLLLSMECCASEQEMNGNVQATIERGYTRLNEYLDAFSGSLSICGSGPSIAQTYQDLSGDVMAINNCLRFLLDAGIVPKFAMFWDAAEVVEQFAVPHPEITYLVGARCHPKVYENLKGCKIITWHAGGDHNINDYLLERKIDEPMVNGGSAGVTRALYLGYALGYRSFHLHGADSSYSEEGATHVNGSVVPEKDFKIWVGNHDGNKSFRTTPEWCGQVEEIKLIYPMFSTMLNCPIKVHGTGLLPYVCRILKSNEDQRLEKIRGENHANAGQ